jgi:quinol monooxygenase YgiN
MSITVIVELQAHPGRRDELQSVFERLLAQHSAGLRGFLGSRRYENLDDPDLLVEVAEWESAEARDAHLRDAAAAGTYAPLAEHVAAPFRVTVLSPLT